MSSADDSPLLMHLRDHDTPCPACKYNLRGITSPVCPECGLALEVGVALKDAPTRLWTTGVVVAALGAGFHGLLGVWVGLMMVRRPRSGPPWDEFFPVPLGFVLTGVTLWILLAKRPAFLRCRSDTAWWIVTLAAAAGLGPFVVLVLLVR